LATACLRAHAAILYRALRLRERGTERLRRAFLDALNGRDIAYGDIATKCWMSNWPYRRRVWVSTCTFLVLWGKSRAREFKAVLRLPGQVVGEYGAFDHSGERLALLAGY
jgi:hypothetical protein